MTVEKYKKWLNGNDVNASSLLLEFYKTKPTLEQESLRSKMFNLALIYGFIDGILLGAVIGFFLGILSNFTMF